MCATARVWRSVDSRMDRFLLRPRPTGVSTRTPYLIWRPPLLDSRYGSKRINPASRRKPETSISPAVYCFAGFQSRGTRVRCYYYYLTNWYYFWYVVICTSPEIATFAFVAVHCVKTSNQISTKHQVARTIKYYWFQT